MFLSAVAALEPGMRGDVACALVFVCSHVSV